MSVGNDPPRPLDPSDILRLLLLLLVFVVILFGLGSVLIFNPDLDDGERGAAQRVVGGLVRGAQVERVPAKSNRVSISSSTNHELMNGVDRQAIKKLSGCKLHPNYSFMKVVRFGLYARE